MVSSQSLQWRNAGRVGANMHAAVYICVSEKEWQIVEPGAGAGLLSDTRTDRKSRLVARQRPPAVDKKAFGSGWLIFKLAVCFCIVVGNIGEPAQGAVILSGETGRSHYTIIVPVINDAKQTQFQCSDLDCVDFSLRY
jgi:hypothetical protein